MVYFGVLRLAHANGKYKEVVKESKKTMKLVDGWTEAELGNKQEVQASLHSSTGNALLELGEYEEALNEHQQDLDLAQKL